MKNFFLIFMGSILIFSAHAQAQDDCDFFDDGEGWCADNNNFYTELLAGVNFAEIERNLEHDPSYHPGYFVSASIGYLLPQGLRLEAEYSYRRNPRKRNRALTGTVQTSSFMANLICDIPMAYWGCDALEIQPFFGVGIGYDLELFSVKGSRSRFRHMYQEFAWQLIGGLSYPVCSTADISLEYRFHTNQNRYCYYHALGIGYTFKFDLCEL